MQLKMLFWKHRPFGFSSVSAWVERADKDQGGSMNAKFQIKTASMAQAVMGPMTLQWRHNERDSFSNHQPHDCLLNR